MVCWHHKLTAITSKVDKENVLVTFGSKSALLCEKWDRIALKVISTENNSFWGSKFLKPLFLFSCVSMSGSTGSVQKAAFAFRASVKRVTVGSKQF